MARRRKDQQFDAELQYHLDRAIAEKVAQGQSPENARREALVEFGGPEQVKESLRDVYRFASLEAAWRNVKSGLRLLRKSPSFSLAVILTLMLGIGANSTVFSAINTVLLRPLPFPRGDELVELKQFDRKSKNPNSFVAPQRLEDWNRLNKTLQAVSGWYVQDVSELSGALPEKVTEALVAPRFLQVWGIAPQLGRDFTFREERFGGPNAALISDRLWRRLFAASPKAVGKQLRLDKSSYTVVGVLPASFRFPVKEADVWVPSAPDAPYAQDRLSTWFTVIGRMKASVTAGHAQADLNAVQAGLGRQFPKSDSAFGVKINPLKDVTIGDVRSSLWMLFGSVTLLLLIACMNIAALLLARTADRTREISVRFALGASRRSVITQLLTECFVLSIPGAALGLLVALGGTRLLRSLQTSLPRAGEISLDWRIAVYTLTCAVAATLLCGLLPALRSTRGSIAGDLAAAGRIQVSSRNPWRWLLVGMQVALALTLLTGAGLFIRSFQELGRVSPGFETAHILVLRVSGNWAETNDYKSLNARVERITDNLRGLPGINAVATSLSLPGTPNGSPTEFRVLEKSSDERKIIAESRFASDGYFSTMRIPMLEGEPCWRHAFNTEGGVVVNRSFAQVYLDGASGVGQHVQLASSQFPLQGRILGIAGNAREQGVDHEPGPTVYWCGSAFGPSPYFLIRTGGEPLAMAAAIRRKIQQLEPARSVFEIGALDDRLSDNLAANRLRTLLLTLFALTAVALVCVGLYGTLSYFVNMRKREVGLRLAIGASRRQIVWHFLGKGILVCALGCAAGLPIALAGAQALSGMLYGVSTLDSITYISVMALVITAGALSSLLPSLRAARVEPMQVLRDE